jgi:hypothetical protein
VTPESAWGIGADELRLASCHIPVRKDAPSNSERVK